MFQISHAGKKSTLHYHIPPNIFKHRHLEKGGVVAVVFDNLRNF